MMTYPPTFIPIEDFWSRQANTQTTSFEFAPFGVPARITSNQPEVLAAARLSAGRFSWQPAPPIPDLPRPPTPIHIQLAVGKADSPPVPADLPERLGYAGVGDWISLSAGEWGYAFAHLPARTAAAFVSPALAAETRLISRYVIDHYLLNFILAEWAMLHASCVLDPSGQRLILMVAPHNTGKSTTALHLLRAGYTFLADGMALLRQQGEYFIAGGYPVGEVKLRDDVLALFPNYSGEAVNVREQRKTVVNLRALHPDRLAETLFSPAAIQLCLVERHRARLTEVASLSAAEAVPVLAANSVYWDRPAKLAHNTAILQALLESASLYRLKIGSDVAGIVSALDAIDTL
ncbi:MAG: hypothetical protein HYR94_05165 [Chloroflexi bacterium]|nr:hypothetical protein [Chloroflexota bacterium]